MPTLLEGKPVAESIYSKIILELSLLPNVPKMVFVLVGEDPASQTYVRTKMKKCLDLGLLSETVELPASVSEDVLIHKIGELNASHAVQGILVQLPLPSHISRMRIGRELDPLKDVDGLHPENAGRLFQGDPRFIPCTPAGILEILKFYSIGVEGSRVVVLGRSEIVGKPVAQLLLKQNATVVHCHSKTKNLVSETLGADILIVAIGKPLFVTAEMVKPGAVVIDVGIHRTEAGLVGDVNFKAVAPKVSAITPVPGGVGPMTIAQLMKNVILAATLQAKPKSSQRG